MTATTSDARRGDIVRSGGRFDVNRWTGWPVVSAVSLLLLVGTLFMLRQPWAPTGDYAVLQLRLMQATEGLPLVGVYSRLGWFHPGPAFLNWELPWFVVFGTRGLILGIVVWHIAMIVLAWWLARRHSPLAGAWVLLGSVLAMLALSPQVISAPWNPYLGAVGVVALVVAAWRTWERDPWATVVLVPLATVLVQAHLGYAPIAIGACLAGIGAFGPRGDGRPPVAAWLAGGFVALLLWTPVIWQQLTGDPGNITALLTAPQSEPRAGLAAGAGALSHAFTPELARWGSSGKLETTLAVPWLLLVPMIAMAVAFKRHHSGGKRALTTWTMAVVGTWVALSAVAGPVFGYLASWVPALVITGMAFSAWVLTSPGLDDDEFAVPRDGVAGRGLVAAVSTVAIFAAGLAAALSASTPAPAASLGEATEALSQGLVAATTVGEPISLTTSGSAGQAQQDDGMDMLALLGGMAAAAEVADRDVAAVGVDLEWSTNGAVSNETASRRGFRVQPIPSSGPSSTALATYEPFTGAEWSRLRAIDEALARPGLTQAETKELLQQRASVRNGRVAVELVPVAGGQ